MPELAIEQLQLPSTYLKQIRLLLDSYIPQAQIWAYGSRVNGGCYDASDLDLVVKFPAVVAKSEVIENAMKLSELKEALSNSSIPIMIQVANWDLIPQSFKDEILAGYVILK